MKVDPVVYSINSLSVAAFVLSTPLPVPAQNAPKSPFELKDGKLDTTMLRVELNAKVSGHALHGLGW